MRDRCRCPEVRVKVYSFSLFDFEPYRTVVFEDGALDQGEHADAVVFWVCGCAVLVREDYVWAGNKMIFTGDAKEKNCIWYCFGEYRS